MMMKRLFLAILFLLSIQGYAQTDVESEIQQRVTFFFQKFHPEAAFIHTSDNLYFTGEMIWYSIYVIKTPYYKNELSSIAYVELRKDDHILCRQKLKLEDGVGSGDFSLPKNLVSGNYQIRGYTSWMKNLSEGNFFESTITLINPDKPSYQKDTLSSEEAETTAISFQEKGDSITVDVSGQPGSIVGVLNNGKLLLLKTMARDTYQFSVSKNQLTGNLLQAALIDEFGKLMAEKDFIIQRNESLLTNRKVFSPRDRIDVIFPTDRNESTNLFSIAVRKNNQPQKKNTLVLKSASWKQILNPAKQTLKWPKEKIIFPKPYSSFEPIAMNVPEALVVSEKNAVTNLDPTLVSSLNRNRFMQQITDAYGVVPGYLKSKAHRLPADITYYPKDFAILPTMEDFLREIVTHVKVKKIKGVKGIRIRNNENTNNIFFYARNPLLVIDGVKTDDPAQILSLDPQDIESICIAYKLNTLNSSGIARYADCGILAVYTKKQTAAAADSQNTIYEGYYIPATFSVPPYLRNSTDKIPDMRKLIYWNSEVKAVGKTELSFHVPDDLGEFIIEIIGVNDDGTLFQAQRKFEITIAD